ncbi:MAG: carboxypeptidase-like regulatory domain-containing protein [Gemmatimonadota bacterium]|nr:carboxypeptidase-like regulatory domain-containing protein [Gemmatimonadota bacterium]
MIGRRGLLSLATGLLVAIAPGSALRPFPAGPAPLAGQAPSIRGTVVSEGDRTPISGAFVSLIDERGRELDGDLTDPRGQFDLEVAADHEGPLFLRVARIGVETWVSEPFEEGRAPTTPVTLEVPIRPVRLAAIDVTVHDQCVVDPDVESQVWTAWDEARKALRTTALAEEERTYRFEMRLFEREIDPETGEVLDALALTRTSHGRAPFRSLSPARFASDGYARLEGDSIDYYMPDAEALLSPEFERAHCFGLTEREVEGARQIGVTFDPVESGRTEIRGTLWIDEESAELRSLAYRYVDPPLGIVDERLGGAARFRRLPDGTFVVSEWIITMPQVERLVDFSGRHLRDRIGTLKEDGGVLLRVFTRRGDPVPPDRPPGR